MQEIFRSLLEQAVDRSGYGVPEITERLGRERTWLYRLLSGRRPVRIEHVQDVYGVLGMPVAEFFAACLVQLRCPHLAAKSDLAANPSALLRVLRGESEPDLGWLEQFRTSRVSRPMSAQGFPLHRSVRRLDDAREYDRRAARVEAEDWLRSFERRSRRRRLLAQETSQLATALGVWASIQRAGGRQALGLKTLELAWELHGENPWIASTGDLLERSAMAVYEHGYPQLAVPLMQRALAIATMLGDQHREAKTLLGLGILAYWSSHAAQARDLLKRVLEHPGADSIRRAAAGNYLIKDLEDHGYLEQARDQISRLAPVLPHLPMVAQLAIRGVEARILESLGDLEGSLAIHEENLTKSEFFSPLDRAVLLLHIFEIQVELGNSRALPGYTGHLASLIGQLEETPLSREVLRELLLRLRSGQKILAEEIKGMREKIASEPKPGDRYPTGSQPG